MKSTHKSILALVVIFLLIYAVFNNLIVDTGQVVAVPEPDLRKTRESSSGIDNLVSEFLPSNRGQELETRAADGLTNSTVLQIKIAIVRYSWHKVIHLGVARL